MGWSNSPPTLQPLQHQPQNAERRLGWLVVACVLSGALGITVSHAQLYKWVDENGKTQYTDTIPPASTDRARKELRADGTVKRETERAATTEEKRFAALKAAEHAKIKAIHDERDRKDKALLNTYTSLVDYDRVRDRALGAVANDVRALQEREVAINQIIASDGRFAPPVVEPVAAPAPAVPAVSGKPAALVRPPVAKSANTLLLEAQSELPRAKDAILSKRRDLEDLTALYANDRIRLSRLIDAENAKMNVDRAPTTQVKAMSEQETKPAKKK